MGPPARDVQGAIQRGVRAGEGFGSPNGPGHTLWKAPRAGEVIGVFFKSWTSTLHFS